MKYIPKIVHITNRLEKRMCSFIPPTLNMESLLCKTGADSIWRKRKKKEKKKQNNLMERRRYGKWEKVEHFIFLHILNLY